MGTRQEYHNLIQGEGYKTPPPTSRLRSGKVYMTYAPKPNRRSGVIKLDPDQMLDEPMDSISDVVTRIARTSSKSESGRTEISYRDEAQSVQSQIDTLRRTPSVTSRPSDGTKVKATKPPTLRSLELRPGSVHESDSLKSSNLGATGHQKTCNCTKEHVDPLCKGKCVGLWVKNTSQTAQKGLKIALPISPDIENVLSNRAFVN